jgi:hypothetical protein
MLVKGAAVGTPEVWGLRVKRAAVSHRPVAKEGDRGVDVRACTLDGEGLLILEDFNTENPLKLKVRDTVVRGNILLRWKSAEADFAKALEWAGRGNIYDLDRAAWVALPPARPGSMSDALPGSPTDLESWKKAVSVEENAQVKTVEFAADKLPIAEQRRPQDYAVPHPEDTPLGANPEAVGPRLGAAKP